jgi:hypothetical protein
MQKYILCWIFCWLSDIQSLSAQSCDQIASYSVYPNAALTPIKTIRLSFHVIMKGDGTGSYHATEDQITNYFNEIILLANHRLSHNELPKPNVSSPLVEDTRLRFLLYHVYYYKDDEAYKIVEDNSSDRDNANWFYHNRIMNRQDVTEFDKNNVLHIIMEPMNEGHLPKPHIEGGQSYGLFDKSWIVFRGFDHHYNHPINNDFVQSIAQCTGHLIHEVGHALGLYHSFASQCDDGCEDNGCPPDNTSNNYMDYSSWRTNRSFSECQISRIHFGLIGNQGNIADIVVDDYCNNLIGPILSVRDTWVVQGRRNWNQSVNIKKSKLVIKCAVSMTAGSKCTVDKGGILEINSGKFFNLCDEAWKGVWIKKRGECILKNTNVVSYDIVVKSGGSLIVEGDIQLLRARIIIESGGYLCIQQGNKIICEGEGSDVVLKEGWNWGKRESNSNDARCGSVSEAIIKK